MEIRVSDGPDVHIGENSPEEVALKLMRLIGAAEKKSLGSQPTASREWILKTYALCLETVREPHGVGDHLAKHVVK
jgi:hypothetical protein